MKNLKIILPILLCFTAVAIIAIFIFKTTTFKPTEVVCPDGNVLELTAVTYGKSHSCPMEHPWNRILQGIPRFIQQRLGIINRNVHTTTENSTVAWFRWKGKTSSWFGNKTVIDAAGYKSEIKGWNYNRKPPTASGLAEIWLGYEIQAYPRRDASFTFRFSDWNEKVIAEFEIKNPNQISATPFSSKPLPFTNNVDDMEFTLVSLDVPNARKMSKEVKQIFQNADVRAIFEIKEEGTVTENWQPVNIWLEDATGNKSKNNSWSNKEKDGKASITFSSGLFHGEPWKIRTQFARKSGFLPTDQWTATIPLPQHPEYTTNLVSQVIHGKKIIIRSIADENNLLLDGTKTNRGRNQNNKKRKQFHIYVEEMNTDLRLDLIKVIDDQGRECKQSGKSWGSGDYDYGLEIEEDAINLTVTLALHKSKYADFIAMPKTLDKVSEE
jgi:hypothetical protein